MLEIIKNYRDNESLRQSFNQLALDIFGLDFEDWYQNGYWTDRYIPYSILIDGEVCANVSVNRTDFIYEGMQKHWLQLGTVMTAEDCRHQGLIRLLMDEIEKDYAGRVDGIYLFANDEVLDFYPKFGFQAKQQYMYVREIKKETLSIPKFTSAPLTDKKRWDDLEMRIRRGCSYAALEMVDNSQLNMFYVSKFMQEYVYYCETLDTYVIAEQDRDTVVIHAVISDKKQDLQQIADGIATLFVKENESGWMSPCQICLGFTPKITTGFVCRELDQTDSMFFVKGDVDVVETKKMMIPTLAHA